MPEAGSQMQCSVCREAKSIEAFTESMRRERARGRWGACKDCRRAAYIEKAGGQVVRRCELEGCDREFIVTARNTRQRFHSYSCKVQAKHIAEAAERAAARADLRCQKCQRPIDNARRRDQKWCSECYPTVSENHARREVYTRYRLRKMLRSVGLTVEQYEAVLAGQQGRCAVCAEECSTGRALAIEHDHATGEFRGLTCSSCNTGIGLFKDDPNLLRAAAEYLEDHAKRQLRLVA